ncbi:MAG: replicative DNA helicase, partial [Limnochordales bacterium]
MNHEETAAGRELFDLGAEQSVLGAMMLAPDVIAEVEGILTPQAFYRPAHAAIFATIVGLHAASRPTDPVAVAAALAETGAITRVGGVAYVHELIRAVPTAANGPHYARIVADRAVLRELDLAARRIQRLVQESSGTAAELVDQAQQLLTAVEPDVRGGGEGESGPTLWRDIIPSTLESIEQAAATADQTPGVPTGLIDLDQLLNGLHGGQLIVIAARPGIGKTLALTGILQHATWRHKLTGALFSLEMSRVELGKRMLSAETAVPHDLIKSGRLDDDQWTRITQAAGESAEAPLWIDDTPNLTLAEIRSRARRLHRRTGGLAIVGIDYLQLVQTGRSENRQVAVAELSRGFKLLAKELNVPVLLVAQLNRGPEHRTDKRPLLADLRESGAIEQDADIVMLLHRDDYYDSESPRAGEADFIVAKHRGGP